MSQTALRLSHRELNRAVLARQHLIERLPAGTGAAAAAASIGRCSAVQPIFLLGAPRSWRGLASAQLPSALDSHDVVKASLMRGTLHL